MTERAKDNIVVHPSTRAMVKKKELCPRCGGELDTGFECNDCGYDALWLVDENKPTP